MNPKRSVHSRVKVKVCNRFFKPIRFRLVWKINGNIFVSVWNDVTFTRCGWTLNCAYPPLSIHWALDGDGPLRCRVRVVVTLRLYCDEGVRITNYLLNIWATSSDDGSDWRIRHTDLYLQYCKKIKCRFTLPETVSGTDSDSHTCPKQK